MTKLVIRYLCLNPFDFYKSISNMNCNLSTGFPVVTCTTCILQMYSHGLPIIIKYMLPKLQMVFYSQKDPCEVISVTLNSVLNKWVCYTYQSPLYGV